jgi:4-amino-4-deoxy-L-arabinose transferase-like glycosyltransferase
MGSGQHEGAIVTGSVAPAARWRAAFVAMFVLLAAIKTWLACTLAPFGDEAFYWQESRHLAWGYSDLPPLTAWLIRFGESIAGHGVFGMRWPFLLLGAALPWLLVAFARRAFADACAAWQAGLLCLLLPLAGTLGVLPLPDVPLTLAILLVLYALLRAMNEGRAWTWLLLGAALAIGWLAHYRAAMTWLAGLLLCALTRRGRALWRRPGWWLALATSLPGLLPLAISNWQLRGAGLSFQLFERNPWRFHADGLMQPFEQALVCTPILYALLLWVAWRCWQRRGRGAPWDVIALGSLGFIVPYFVLGLFADAQRFRVHWPLPGYLPLLAALPMLCREYGARVWPKLAAALAAAGLCIVLAYLGMAADGRGAARLAGFKAFPYGFVGWREGAHAADALLRRQPKIVVADNFMLAAEWDFLWNGRRPVYTLDSPLNVEHGRAAQLASWRRDEAALRAAHSGAPVLLAVDEASMRERSRPAWLGSVCDRLDGLRPLGRLDLFAGAKRFAFYAATVPMAPLPAGDPATCIVWRNAHAAQYGDD